LPRVCTICRHESRYDIDALLVDRSMSYRAIAQHYGVSKDAIGRHVSSGHISELLALARDAETHARADSLLDRLEALQYRTEAALTKAEESENHFATFRGISEMRRNLELIGEVTKELNRSPTLNLHLNPQYIAVRSGVIQAVEPYPEAKEAISKAMLQLESEDIGNGIA
jgi:hypothetical protein